MLSINEKIYKILLKNDFFRFVSITLLYSEENALTALTHCFTIFDPPTDSDDAIWEIIAIKRERNT